MPIWQLGALLFWLLAAATALATATAWQAGASAELTVEAVKADAYPRVTARFKIEPDVGTPPTNLELRDVLVVEGTTRKEPLEVYAVGRAPTDRVGTYEVVWMSTEPVQPGQTIVGRVSVARSSLGDLEADYRFIRPLPKLAAAEIQSQRVELPVVVPQPRVEPPDIAYVGSVAGTLVGIAILCGAAAVVWRAKTRHDQERLAIWVADSAPMRSRAAERAKSSGRNQSPLSPLMVQLGKMGTRLVSKAQSEKLKEKLVLAGRSSPQEYTRFVAIKAGLGLLLFGLGTWLMLGRAPLLNAIAVAACMAVTGFILPSMWLGRRIKRRQYSMRKSMPDALDLMTIGVSAGLAFDGAIAEIVTKWDNDLGHEFSLLLGDLRVGTGRRDALLNLVDRTRVDEIQTMVSQLIQSEELGMSLTETLMTLSNQMRLRRRQHAEELAQKAAVKMLIPLVFLIFPALFIVILGPSVQDMYTFVTQGPK